MNSERMKEQQNRDKAASRRPVSDQSPLSVFHTAPNDGYVFGQA